MLYEDLRQVDILGPLEDQLNSGQMRLEMNEDGNVCIRLKHFVDHKTPWVYSVTGKDRFCVKWLQFYHRYYNFVPKGCHGCFKTMCRPRNLKETMQLAKVQKELGIHSKIGMEQRPYASGLWGAFWYGPILEGLEGGRKTYETVSEAVAKVSDVKLWLKRGCTEMEYQAGPSDRWQYLPEHEVLEEMLDKLFVSRPLGADFGPPTLQVNVMRRWVEWAHRYGDPTVWEYADRKSFLPDYVKYNGSDHVAEDFKPLIKEPPSMMTLEEFFKGGGDG